MKFHLVRSPWSRRARTTIAAAVTITLASLGACGSNAGPEGSGDPTNVKIGAIGVAGAAGYKIAMEDGYFEEAGLTYDEVDLRTPGDVVPNLLNGTIQLGGLNPGNLAQALSEGLDLRIIGSTYFANDDIALLSMKGSGITSPKDLEGKKIGMIALENPVHAALLEILTEAGVDIDSVEFVLVPVPDMPAALRSGQIDAGNVLQPLAATMAEETEVVVEDLTEPYGDQVVMAYDIVSGAFADENPDVVVKLQEVLARGSEVASTDDERRIEATMALTGAPMELIRAGIPPAFGTDLSIETSNRQVELLVKYGFLEAPIDLADHVFKP